MSKHTPGPWSQGTTLHTRITRSWSDEQWQANERREKCSVYSGFTGRDEGRSRIAVAHCVRPEDARLISATPQLLEVILLLQDANWKLDDAAGMEIRRKALAAVQKAMDPIAKDPSPETNMDGRPAIGVRRPSEATDENILCDGASLSDSNEHDHTSEDVNTPSGTHSGKPSQTIRRGE